MTTSDSDWYARRLGRQPQQRQSNYPPETYQARPQQYQAAPQQQPQQQGYFTVDTAWEAAQYWQGGEGMKTERNPCPKCGSDHYFSRSNGDPRGPSPAPMCYACGYNGMFQQGDPAVWQAN